MGILLLPNILAVATSTVARFTVLLNPPAGWVAATKLSLEPPRILLAPDPNKSVNLDKLLKLPRSGMDPLSVSKAPVTEPVRLLATPDKLLSAPVAVLDKLLKLPRLTPPKLFRALSGLVAPVANCEALPKVSMAVFTVGSPGTPPSVKVPKLGMPGNVEVNDPIDGRLDVIELIDGMLLAHCAVRSVPNLPALESWSLGTRKRVVSG